MGVINDFLRLEKGTEIKSIFKYTSGKGTINGILVTNINIAISQLIAEGWQVA